MSTYVDTHCHLDLFQNIQKRMQEEDSSGIKTITVTNAPSFFKANQALFQNATNIRVALGFHPQLVSQYVKNMPAFEEHLAEARFIGEIGLDGTRELAATFKQQSAIFVKVLSVVARSEKKVLTVHSRSAATETISMLHQYLRLTRHKVILHWFTGSIIELQEAIRHGFYFSINHKMVSTERGKQIISAIPVDKILTETDTPFTFSGGIQTRIQSLEASIKGIADIKRIDERVAQMVVFDNFRTLLQ